MNHTQAKALRILEIMKDLESKGVDTIILKGLDCDVLKELLKNSPPFHIFEEDACLGFKWYRDVIRPENLMETMESLQGRKVAMTSWFYAVIDNFAKILKRVLGKRVVAINCNVEPVDHIYLPASESILDEYEREIFDINKGRITFVKDPSDSLEMVQMYDPPKITEMLNFETLLSTVSGKKIKVIDKSAEFETLLKSKGLRIVPGFSNDIDYIVTSQKERENEYKLAEIAYLLGCSGKKVEILRFAGYYSQSESTSKVDLTDYLRKSFLYETFIEYPVYTSEGSKTSISQEVLVRFLIDQHFEEKPKDLFFIASTGSGKSLIYQLVSAVLKDLDNSLTIVISPLKALMEDQVFGMRKFRGFNAEYINSSLTYEERTTILEKVKSGEVDILYLSPETFIQHRLEHLIGSRKIGLFVVDEAHLVNTWGRTFRVDYGYIGDQLKLLRKDTPFPVLATTATAIYGGPLDTVSEIVESLSMKNPWVVLTDVRCHNIDIQIEYLETDGKRISRLAKIEDSVQHIKELAEKNVKTIVYCPFVKQAEDIKIHLEAFSTIKDKVALYTGRTDDEDRKRSYHLFKNGDYSVIVATKAFGMGINIEDIEVVYHHCVPNILMDYIQEIGRGGRNNKPAYATTHYAKSDPNNGYLLSSFSIPQQWKLNHIINHIAYQVRAATDRSTKSKKVDITVSLDDIKYILFTGDDWDEDQLRNKARVALYLIQKDLEAKNGRPIIYRKSENYQYIYFTAKDDVAEELMERFPEIRKYDEPYTRKSMYRDQEIRSEGSVYVVDVRNLWEKYFREQNISRLVWLIVNKPLEVFGKEIHPKVKAEVTLKKPLNAIRSGFENLLRILDQIADSTPRQVSVEVFENAISNALKSFPNLTEKEEMRTIVLNYFTEQLIRGGQPNPGHYFWKQGDVFNRRFVAKDDYIRKSSKRTWELAFESVVQGIQDNQVTLYFNAGDDQDTRVKRNLLNVMDILNLMTTHFSGGDSTIIQIACLDRAALLRQSGEYSCELTKRIKKRLNLELKIARAFYETPMDSDERWDFIEQYLCGLLDLSNLTSTSDETVPQKAE